MRQATEGQSDRPNMEVLVLVELHYERNARAIGDCRITNSCFEARRHKAERSIVGYVNDVKAL